MIQFAEIFYEMFVSGVKGANIVTQQIGWTLGWEEQSYKTRWSSVMIIRMEDVVGVCASLYIALQMWRQNLRNQGIYLLQ